MNTFRCLVTLLITLQFVTMPAEAFEYRSIKSGMTFQEIKSLQGIKVSGWTGRLTVNKKKYFGKGKNPPGLSDVLFDFTDEEHGQKLWRVALKFKKIDINNFMSDNSPIDEVAQKQAIQYLYPEATLKEVEESYKCGDWDFNCKASGNGVHGYRTWIYVLLIDSEIFKDAVDHKFERTVDLY
jgi:hypothetical protein